MGGTVTCDVGDHLDQASIPDLSPNDLKIPTL